MHIGNRSVLINRSLTVFILLLILLIDRYFYGQDKIIFFLAIGLSAILVYRSFSSTYLPIFYIFVFTYILFLYPYFLKGIGISGFYNFNYKPYLSKGLLVFSIFLGCLLFFYRDRPSESVIARIKFKRNRVIFAINVIIQLLIIFFGKSGDLILDVRYGLNNIETSTIHEYYPIFYLAAFIYSGNKKINIRMINIIAAIYCIYNLLLGSRGAIFSMGIIYYLLFMERNSSPLKIMVFVTMGLLFLSFWSAVRTQTYSALSFDLEKMLGLARYTRYNIEGTNQTDVFYASVRMIAMADLSIISPKEQLYAFFFFIAAIVLPFSYLPPIANLSKYMVEDLGSLGGGIIFSYFYVWLSYLGVILIAYYINFIWDKLRTTRNQYMLMYTITAFATFSGWFAYTPITLFKFCTWAVLYLLVLNGLNSLLKGRRVAD